MADNHQELTVREAALARRSIRKYTEEPVSDETIHELLRLAGTAPTPWNLQPWRVIAVKNKEELQKIQEIAFGQPQVGASAVTFVVYTDMDDTLANIEETVHPGLADQKDAVIAQIKGHFGNYAPADLHWWARAQGYTFLGYLMLLAQSMGYSTSPMLGFDQDKLKAHYNLPETAQVPFILSMGRPAEEGFPHHRHPNDRFVKII